MSLTLLPIAGYPLFPGENEVEQLGCMMEILGIPPSSLLEQAMRKKMFFGEFLCHLHSCFMDYYMGYFLVLSSVSPLWNTDSNSNPRILANSSGRKHYPGSKDLGSVISCKDAHFLHFLQCCLQWDKNQRAGPDELLQHPWILGVSQHDSSNFGLMR